MPKGFNPPSLLLSFKHAWDGISNTIHTQSNFRFQGILAVLAIILAYFLHFEYWKWGILLITISVVLGFELLNSSIEALVDAKYPHLSAEAKIAKDTAAGAVLVTAIGATGIGFLLFLPPLLEVIGKLAH